MVVGADSADDESSIVRQSTNVMVDTVTSEAVLQQTATILALTADSESLRGELNDDSEGVDEVEELGQPNAPEEIFSAQQGKTGDDGLDGTTLILRQKNDVDGEKVVSNRPSSENISLIEQSSVQQEKLEQGEKIATSFPIATTPPKEQKRTRTEPESLLHSSSPVPTSEQTPVGAFAIPGIGAEAMATENRIFEDESSNPPPMAAVTSTRNGSSIMQRTNNSIDREEEIMGPPEMGLGYLDPPSELGAVHVTGGMPDRSNDLPQLVEREEETYYHLGPTVQSQEQVLSSEEVFARDVAIAIVSTADIEEMRQEFHEREFGEVVEGKIDVGHVRRRRLLIGFVVAVVVIIGVVVGVIVGLGIGAEQEVAPSATPSQAPSSVPSTSPTFTDGTQDLWDLLVSVSPRNATALINDRNSAQRRAFEWLAIDVTMRPPQFRDRTLQRYALACLWYSTNGEGWTNKGSWLTHTPLEEWVDIADGDPFVRLPPKLRGNNLTGTLPPEIGLLTNLQHFQLPDNRMTGTIPPEVFLATGEGVNLNENKFTGTFPTIPPGTTRALMFYVSCSGCSLTGTLPSDIASFPRLSNLDLSGNKLHGTIPTEFGLMTVLSNLDLSQSGIRGEIPSELGNCDFLRRLDLSDNRLGGTLPSDMGRLSFLGDLRLKENDIGGRLPSELGQCESLGQIDLVGNSFTGPIPTEIFTIPLLKDLVFSYNNFSSTLPTEIGISPIRFFRARSNSFMGQLPSEIGTASKLLEMLLSENQFSGSLPSELALITDFEVLDLMENDLSGSLPTQLATLQYVRYMNFAGNEKLNGSFPCFTASSVPSLELILDCSMPCDCCEESSTCGVPSSP